MQEIMVGITLEEILGIARYEHRNRQIRQIIDNKIVALLRNKSRITMNESDMYTWFHYYHNDPRWKNPPADSIRLLSCLTSEDLSKSSFLGTKIRIRKKSNGIGLEQIVNKAEKEQIKPFKNADASSAIARFFGDHFATMEARNDHRVGSVTVNKTDFKLMNKYIKGIMNFDGKKVSLWTATIRTFKEKNKPIYFEPFRD